MTRIRSVCDANNIYQLYYGLSFARRVQVIYLCVWVCVFVQQLLSLLFFTQAAAAHLYAYNKISLCIVTQKLEKLSSKTIHITMFIHSLYNIRKCVRWWKHTHTHTHTRWSSYCLSRSIQIYMDIVEWRLCLISFSFATLEELATEKMKFV